MERARGRCEAIGARYGYQPGERCQRPVAAGAVNFEHYPRGAHDPHPETRTLVNCTAICPQCNQHANNKHDTPYEAKRKRLLKKHGPVDERKKSKKPLRSRPFQKVTRPIPSKPFPKARTK